MLPKQNRLQKEREFQRVFKSSRPINLEHFAIRVAKNLSKAENIRFGFIISNKIDKRSTRRNALKRQLREISRSLILQLKPGYDVVVIVKRNPVYPYDQEKNRMEYEEGLRKAGVIKI